MVFGKTVRRSLAALAVVAALVSLGACGSANAAQDTDSGGGEKVRTIVAATGASPAPYVFRGDDRQLTGQNKELTEAIFKKLPQYRLKWEITENVFPGLDSGRYQIGVNSYAKNPERAEKYLFSDPLYTVRYVVEVPKGSPITADSVNTLGDLKGKTVLLDPGTAVATAVENWNRKHPDQALIPKYTGTGSDISSKFRQVEAGQADLAIDNLALFNYYTTKQKFNLTAIKGGSEFDKAIGSDAYCYLLFPKGEDQLVKDVNKAFQELVKDGTSKQLNEKWFGEDLTVTGNKEA